MPSIGLATLVVLAVAAGGAFLLGLRRAVLPLSILLAGVALRDFTSRWLFTHTEMTVETVTAIGRWWFAAIIGLLAAFAWGWAREGRPEIRRVRLRLADYLFALVCVVAVASTFLSPNSDAALTSLRGYLQPMALYPIARSWRPSRTSLKWLLGMFLVMGVLMAAFGIWQGAAWGEADYRAQGYVRQNGELVTPPVHVAGRTYIRPASTVSGPNEFGIDMVVMFSMAFMAAVVFRDRTRLLAAGAAVVMTLGLIVTFSRSGFLGYFLSWAVLLVLAWRLNARTAARMDRRVVLRIAGIAGTVLVIALVAFAFSGFFGLVRQTIESLSNQYHIRDTSEAIQFLVQQPQGVGMGLVEPKGALSLIEQGGTYHVEGSLFQIAMEMGVWGLAVWLLYWLVSLWTIAKNTLSVDELILKAFSGAALAGWMGSLVAFVFLPLMQSISLMVWLWFLLGLGVAVREIEALWAAQSAEVRMTEMAIEE